MFAMPSAQKLDTHHKALTLNLDPSTFGSFAGQEVARWFLLVGGASGTVAKTISAYDKEVSDAMRRRLRRSLTAVAKWCQRAPTCTNGPAAEDPQRQAPRPLPVLRPTDELSEPSEVLSGCRKDLEEVAQSPHAREPDDVGEIQTPPSSVSFAVTSDSTSLDVPGESCLRNPLREICTVGSVREEIPVVPWWTYTGTKLETADTAKENLQPIGTPLLGERRSYANNLPTLPLLQ